MKIYFHGYMVMGVGNLAEVNFIGLVAVTKVVKGGAQ